jgi:uncharacterized repeat protein (TIGR03803 family)
MLRLVSGAILSLLLTTTQAQTNFQQILSFGPSLQSGSWPQGELLEGSDGFLYGTTYGGGNQGLGSVFKTSKNGSEFISLRSLTNDAYFPVAGLVESSDGVLLGTTPDGGANGAGTVFKMNKDGSGFSLLHIFAAGPGDGGRPQGRLVAAAGGMLFGTAFNGGAANKGVVFAMKADGSGYTILHNFAGTNSGDGSFPFASLCQGSDAALYGTTQGGGSNDLGSVFRLSSDGTGYAVLHHFNGGADDGRMPLGSLVQGSDGFLYGTTQNGGTHGLGTIFKLNTNGGGYVVLQSFAGGSTGSQPFAGLVAGSNGVLYGTTRFGGSHDLGTAFKVNTDGTGYATLHSFGGSAGDGSQPLAPLLMGSDGALYGSTHWGGMYETNGVYGTLFKLSSPVVITAQPLDQTVGAGQNASFSVTATGTLPVSYQWRFNATPIAGATDSTYGRANVQITDAGSYSVIVSNAVAGVTSSNAVLTVTQETPFQIDSITPIPDGQIQLQASAPPGHYAIEATTDFVAWAELTNLTTTSNSFQYIDSATNLSHRFYRLRRIP